MISGLVASWWHTLSRMFSTEHKREPKHRKTRELHL